MRWLVGLALVAITAAALAPLATAAEAPAVVWDRALGGTLDDEFTGIAPADGGFVLAGSTRSNDGKVLGNHGQGDAWAVRVDRYGQVLWQRPLGGTSLDDGAGLQSTGDGGFVLAANARSADGDVTVLQGGVDAWAVRLDGAGNLAWQRTYGGTLQDMAAAVALVPVGGHVLVGNTYSSNGNVTGGHGGSDAWVIRLDAGGNLLWQRCLGGSGDDHAADVLPTADGGFLVAATVHSKDGDVTGFHDAPGFVCDAWLAKLNATGGLVWQRAYGGTGSDYATALAPAADGGYVMAGYTYSADGDIALNRGWSDVWVMKVSATGAPAWGRTYGGSQYDYAGGVRQTADGGYVVAGYANSADGNVTGTHGGYDAWVLRLDAGGNLLWQKALGGLGLDSAMDVLLPADGGYLVAGGTYSTSPFVTGQHGGKDAWLVRLGADPSAVVVVPSGSGAPRDGNTDGRYEDVNGNGRADFADVVLYFNQMSWIAGHEPVVAFDCNGNGRIDFADVVRLFNNL